jgi:transcriptional regulator GlxA family with amidase domain
MASTAPFHASQTQLSRARVLMDKHYDHPLDLVQLSRQASFSRYHFIRLFREAYRRTPHQYLMQKRIEKAKVLLASSQLPVTEICLEVGFQSLGSFSALFHKYVGRSPSEYRAWILKRKRYPQRYIPGCFLSMAGVKHPMLR